MRDPFDSDGEGDDLEEIAFKCLLRPDTLPHKLNKWSRDQRAGVAKKMLEGLQAERIRDAAALAQVAPAPPQNAGVNNVVPGESGFELVFFFNSIRLTLFLPYFPPSP